MGSGVNWNCLSKRGQGVNLCVFKKYEHCKNLKVGEELVGGYGGLLWLGVEEEEEGNL